MFETWSVGETTTPAPALSSAIQSTKAMPLTDFPPSASRSIPDFGADPSNARELALLVNLHRSNAHPTPPTSEQPLRPLLSNSQSLTTARSADPITPGPLIITPSSACRCDLTLD